MVLEVEKGGNKLSTIEMSYHIKTTRRMVCGLEEHWGATFNREVRTLYASYTRVEKKSLCNNWALQLE